MKCFWLWCNILYVLLFFVCTSPIVFMYWNHKFRKWVVLPCSGDWVRRNPVPSYPLAELVCSILKRGEPCKMCERSLKFLNRVMYFGHPCFYANRPCKCCFICVTPAGFYS
jgi:hypothetical protein